MQQRHGAFAMDESFSYTVDASTGGGLNIVRKQVVPKFVDKVISEDERHRKNPEQSVSFESHSHAMTMK